MGRFERVGYPGLMTYVGWRDIKAAMRYLDGVDVGLQGAF